ncbi:MAG: hypothetical protein WB558_02990 [Terriglobales bacterium]
MTDVKRLPEQHSQRGVAVKAPVKCSPTGDLYVEFEGGGAEPGVSVISEDRGHINRFDLERIPELEGAQIRDFAPGTNHDLFLLSARNTGERGPTQYYIAHLKEGSSTSVTKLDVKPGFRLNQMTVLGSDNFLISGFFGWQHQHAEPFVAIFDTGGQFVRELALEGDLKPRNQSPNVTGKDPLGGSAEDAARSDIKSVEWLELSSLQTAQDGSAYLMRYSPEGPVFTISPGGAVRRTALKPPEKESVLSSIKIEGDKVAAEYYVPASHPGAGREKFLTVTDLSTGQLLDTVRYVGSGMGVGMVCYRGSTFEFLHYAADGHLEVISAVSH